MRRWTIWGGAAAGLAVAFLLVYLHMGGMLWPEPLRELARLATSREALRRVLEEHRAVAPVLFILIQAAQVVAAPIPGEVTGFLGGYFFGVLKGFIYSAIGLTLGSVLAFGLGHWLGQPFVRRLVKPETYERFAFLTETRGALVAFVLFLIPGFPKDYLSYLLGVSPMRFLPFLVVCALGRLPGTYLLSLQGDRVGGRAYLQGLIILTAVVVLCVVGYLARGHISTWAQGNLGQPPPRKGAPD
ncbi:MAG: TVP38/TMEM64 family protein, partial [candidate division NC10 bacterium]|nr:TVP38/TMEM64 family protein [candidate division NC10 bacterium]